MAINFPDSPSTNDTYVAAGSRWLWNGTAWVRQGTPVEPVAPWTP